MKKLLVLRGVCAFLDGVIYIIGWFFTILILLKLFKVYE